jgi:hypothetical protein
VASERSQQRCDNSYNMLLELKASQSIVKALGKGKIGDKVSNVFELLQTRG